MVVRATTLSGAGKIDASGGEFASYNYGAGSAGGGRVALSSTPSRASTPWRR